MEFYTKLHIYITYVVINKIEEIEPDQSLTPQHISLNHPLHASYSSFVIILNDGVKIVSEFCGCTLSRRGGVCGKGTARP